MQPRAMQPVRCNTARCITGGRYRASTRWTRMHEAMRTEYPVVARHLDWCARRATWRATAA
jgi:hypothetical protein